MQMKKNTERLTVLIDPYTKQRLGQSADEEDKTTSQIIRGLIKLYLVDAEARRGAGIDHDDQGLIPPGAWQAHVRAVAD